MFNFLKGWVAELKTQASQSLFMDSDEYHIFNDVLIQTDRFSSQIDHVIVSNYGIFVIETKQRGGWIFGDPDHEYWTQVLPRRKIKFQNPLRQNDTHVRQISKFLSVRPDKIFSVVIFWGNCYFKTPMPENVIKGNLFNSHVGYIHSKTAILFTDEEVSSICTALQGLKDNTYHSDKVNHIYSVRERYSSSTICPKCGGKLVERTARKGNNAGSSFLGCENFPKCRFTKDFSNR